MSQSVETSSSAVEELIGNITSINNLLNSNFKAVAGEIRKLAENSSKETKSIDEVLHSMKVLVDSISEKIGVVAREFDSIVTLSAQVKMQEDLVQNAVTEQSNGSALLMTNISEMKDVQASLSDAAEKLKLEMDEIKVTMSNLEV